LSRSESKASTGWQLLSGTLGLSVYRCAKAANGALKWFLGWNLTGRLLFFLSLLVLFFRPSGDAAESKSPATTVPQLAVPVAAAVSGTDLDQDNLEKVRTSEAMKAYPVGRYIDPKDPNVMHEAHVVYRREAGGHWNLNPNAPTVVPLGPVFAVADPARVPSPLPAELEQKIAEQNQLVAALIEQNEALTKKLMSLAKDISELRRAQAPGISEGKK
jgi:hypothetical protein